MTAGKLTKLINFFFMERSRNMTSSFSSLITSVSFISCLHDFDPMNYSQTGKSAGQFFNNSIFFSILF